MYFYVLSKTVTGDIIPSINMQLKVEFGSWEEFAWRDTSEIRS